ncbi:MAG: YqgE/AlgH family protein [Cytophagales bacterium]|nr:YqgE/AlgH family protein [Cytophagales bacterium]
MDSIDFRHLFKSNKIRVGDVLVAEPFLSDENFYRSVVLICDHTEDTFLGLIQNCKIDDCSLSHIIPNIRGSQIPVYTGGPVDGNLLQYLHRFGDEIEDSIALSNGVYWGGNFDQLTNLINQGIATEENVKFFLGYAGWGEDQLKDELNKDCWVLTQTKLDVICHNEHELWKDVLLEQGEQYKVLTNTPANPNLN